MLGTILDDRMLWYDGDISIDPADLIPFVKKHRNVTPFVLKETAEVVQYNKLSDKKITTKRKVRPSDFSWNIPNEYKTLDVERYVENKLSQLNLPSPSLAIRKARVQQELAAYKQLNLLDVLRTIIYVINTLTSHNKVWGVGRGSSVSSYVLYLIGVHDIDSVEYQLDFHDFLRYEKNEQQEND